MQVGSNNNVCLLQTLHNFPIAPKRPMSAESVLHKIDFTSQYLRNTHGFEYPVSILGSFSIPSRESMVVDTPKFSRPGSRAQARLMAKQHSPQKPRQRSAAVLNLDLPTDSIPATLNNPDEELTEKERKDSTDDNKANRRQYFTQQSDQADPDEPDKDAQFEQHPQQQHIAFHAQLPSLAFTGNPGLLDAKKLLSSQVLDPSLLVKRDLSQQHPRLSQCGPPSQFVCLSPSYVAHVSCLST
jgi:hypothetical protein